MRLFTRFAGLFVACAFVIANSAHAQDWPQWRGPNRDAKLTGFNAPAAWPKELTQKWKVTVGTGDSTPALVGDKLYVHARQGDDEVLLCLNAADGKEVWNYKYATPAIGGPASRHPGPRSSPAVADGKVVALGINGVLSCVDATSGKLVWTKDPFPGVLPKFFTSMSPLIVDGLCIVQLGAQANGGVLAYDLATGDEKWKWMGEGPGYASPMLMTIDGIGEKLVVAQTEKSLVGLVAADGKLAWQVATPTQGRFNNSTTPVIDGNTVYYTGQGTGTKAIAVAKEAAGYTAKELWSNPDVGAGFATPVLKDGLLFGLTDKGSAYCLNAKTGKTAWVDTATRRDSFGAIVDAGNAILALPSDSQIIAFSPVEAQYTEVARYKVSETATYAFPVVSGTSVYTRDLDSLTLWTIQ